MTRLRGITWDHPRGRDSLRAVTDAFRAATDDMIEWTARPLSEFEDVPVEILARDYDILAIDHPFIGAAVAASALVPLDTVLSASELAEIVGDCAGPSQLSYFWDGRHWALALDAACQVSAYRPDLLRGHSLPHTWAEFENLSDEIGPERLAIAANPTHLWCTLLSLCESTATDHSRAPDGRPGWWSDDAIDPDRLSAGIAHLWQLLNLCAPESLLLDPISLLEGMSISDSYIYAPLAFGYVTYSTAHDGRHRLGVANPPSDSGGVVGTVAGGVGLAVSAHSATPALAAEFLAFAMRHEIQAGVFLESGGQPGRDSVWSDPASGRFFTDTYDTMARSFLRPRSAGFPVFQQRASALLHRAAIRREDPEGVATDMIRLRDRDAA